MPDPIQAQSRFLERRKHNELGRAHVRPVEITAEQIADILASSDDCPRFHTDGDAA